MAEFKILFLGYAVPEAQANVLSGASIAGNKMQLGLMRSLTQSPQPAAIDALTILPIAPFPKDRKIVVRGTDLNLEGTLRTRAVGFVNLPLLKQVTQVLSIIHQGFRWVRRRDYDCVLTYNMYPQTGIAAWLFGRLFQLPVVSLLADLPIDHIPNRRGLSRALVSSFHWITECLIRTCRFVIVLNQFAAELYAPKARAMVMDGAVDTTSASATPVRSPMDIESRKHVVFTGALTSYNGVSEMIEAMRMVRSRQVILDIYGDGPLADEAQAAARTSSNIDYHGQIDSSAVASIHRNAFLLLNPRRTEDLISQVTFPSKLLEYMLSGTPVLTSRLNGLTADYEGKVFFLNDDSAVSIAGAIDDLSARPFGELQRTAEAARAFILYKRSWAARGPEILRFLRVAANQPAGKDSER